MKKPPDDLQAPSSGADPLFAAQFTSEKLLQRAIAGLLYRIPENSGVTILQGAQEHGKDIVFFSRVGFDERILCACVVKNAKITGSVSASSGARTVLLQAQQALDTPYVADDGRRIAVERVYVVTPYSLSQSTMQSIEGRLQERAGQVAFLGGTRLFELFHRYWPDYLVDEFSVLKRHVSETEAAVVRGTELREVAFQYQLGPIDRDIRRTYINPAFHRKIQSFVYSIPVLAPLPNVAILRNNVRLETIQLLHQSLDSLAELFEALERWSYISTTDIGRLSNLLESYGDLLEPKISEADKLKRKPGVSVEHVRFENAIEVDRRGRSLQEAAAQSLESFDADLDTVRGFVRDFSLNGTSALSTQDFITSGTVNDIIRTLPPDCFSVSKEKEVKLPETLLNSWQHSLMIVGQAGSGKTSFCRWHALADCENFSVGNSRVLPVYVALKEFNNTKEVTSFRQAFTQNLGRSALLAHPDEGEISEFERVRVYLDGLDEVSSQQTQEHILGLAKAATIEDSNLQVVLTARDYDYAPAVRWLPKVQISRFSDDQVRELVTKWLDENQQDIENLYSQLKRAPALKELMKTPLLGTLVILVFRQTKTLPKNEARLYDIFISLLSAGWDLVKGVQRPSRFEHREKLMLLSRLASHVHQKGSRQFGETELSQVLEDTSPVRRDTTLRSLAKKSSGTESLRPPVRRWNSLICRFRSFLSQRIWWATLSGIA